MRSGSTKEPKLKKSRKGLLIVSGFSSKKQKLGLEYSVEGPK